MSPREQRLAYAGIVDPKTGELTSYGEEIAENRYYGTWAMDECPADCPGGPDPDPDYWGVR